jgi:hypothetical protein
LNMNVIVETNWMNKELRKGINEHFRSLEQACESIYGAELIGLYKPLNESWNWTSFMKVDTLEKWRIVEKEAHSLYPDVDNNVSQSMSRFYWGLDTGRQPPPIRDLGSLKYLVMDLSLCNVDLRMQEYYAQRCEQFTGLEGAGLLGLYTPLSENWNWALIKLFDSLIRYLDVGKEHHRTHRRIPEITSGIERVYEKYEP